VSRQLGGDLEPGPIGQKDIQEDGLGAQQAGCRYCLGRIGGLSDNRKAGLLEQPSGELPERRVVVDDEDSRTHVTIVSRGQGASPSWISLICGGFRDGPDEIPANLLPSSPQSRLHQRKE